MKTTRIPHMRKLLPAGFLAVVGLLAAGLRRDPHQLPSTLVGQAAPGFDLPLLQRPGARLSPAALRGRVWLLNVWASWCTVCRAEHPLLAGLARQGGVTVIGLNYKDEREDALRWLVEAGNPYTASAVDRDGAAGIDYGVYGVPETFVIDRRGVVRYRLAGPLTQASLDGVIMPLLRSLRQEGGDG